MPTAQYVMPSPEIAIVTDSATDIPPEISHALKLDGTVDTSVTFGNENYLYPSQIDLPGFLDKLGRYSGKISTAAAGPELYKAVYRQVGPDTRILSIHISGNLSSVFNNAVAAAGEFPNVTPYDTQFVSIAAGFQVIQALEMRNSGAGSEEILANLHRMTGRTVAFAVPQSLNRLVGSGRIPWALGLTASLLKILPVVRIDPDSINEDHRVRTFSKALDDVQGEVERHHAKFGGIERIAVLHLGMEDKALSVARNLSNYASREHPLVLSSLSPVIAAHIGPAVGVIFVTNNPIRQ